MAGIVGLEEIQHPNGTSVATVNSAGYLQDTGGHQLSAGFVRLASAEWTTDTDGVNFDVIDPAKYTNYFLYWYVSHSYASSSDHWEITGLYFRTASGTISSGTVYRNNVMWVNPGSTSESVNNTSYAGDKNCAWLAGNGSGYDSHGYCTITTPNSSLFKASIRGSSQLVHRSSNDHYREDFSSTLEGSTKANAITGVRFASWDAPTGRYSQFGSVQLYGLTK